MFRLPPTLPRSCLTCAGRCPPSADLLDPTFPLNDAFISVAPKAWALVLTEDRMTLAATGSREELRIGVSGRIEQ